LPTERPKKIKKKSDDVEEPEEEVNVAGDPPAETGECPGSDCGTEKDSEVGAPTKDSPENGSGELKEEKKEDESDGPKGDDPPGDAETALKETKAAPVDVNSEEAKATEASDDAGAEPKAEEATRKDAEAAAPGVPSGLPSTPMDPAQAATVTNPDSMVEERAELEKVLVGRVIGKGGEMIRDLQVSLLLYCSFIKNTT